MKALFVSNLPSPYRVDFFNHLSSFCDLTVIYERHSAADRDKEWARLSNGKYEIVFLNSLQIGADKSISFELIQYFKHNLYDKIIFCGFSSPTVIIGILYCYLNHIKYFIESDGCFEHNNTEQFLKKRIKHLLIKGCEGILTTCEIDKKEFISLGVPEPKIKKYPFSSVWNNDILERCIKKNEKQLLRDKLRLKGENIILSVGRFIPVKGFDVLIRAANLVDTNTNIYIIGGKPTEEYLELCKNSNNVHFVGFMNKDELKSFYCAADVFVLPTRGDVWGLVINEAMACGLPVITTDKCGAGLEMIKNGENGFIVPTDDTKALADKINYCIKEQKMLESFSENALLTAKEYTIEKMVDRHINVLMNNVEM